MLLNLSLQYSLQAKVYTVDKTNRWVEDSFVKDETAITLTEDEDKDKDKDNPTTIYDNSKDKDDDDDDEDPVTATAFVLSESMLLLLEEYCSHNLTYTAT